MGKTDYSKYNGVYDTIHVDKQLAGKNYGLVVLGYSWCPYWQRLQSALERSSENVRVLFLEVVRGQNEELIRGMFADESPDHITFPKVFAKDVHGKMQCLGGFSDVQDDLELILSGNFVYENGQVKEAR